MFMPRILIPLRPILGVLQIGIKSQGYREPGYIRNGPTLRRDLEEDDEEDPEEDPADYPADRGDDDDEHLAPAEPAAVAYSNDRTLIHAYSCHG
ncbi:hypothetical protein Tco_0669315 [Tanacetum coccineum]